MKQDSPNFSKGKFHNLSHTPQLTEGYTFGSVFKEMFFRKHPDKIPTRAIPTVKTNLLELAKEEEVLIWFGHSSYFIQVDGKRFLIDPVLSGNAAPIRGMIEAFRGTKIYTVEDLPEIDYLIITHDHYDHLDRKTIIRLKSKVKQVVCGLGVGAHLQKWGYDSTKIKENDWYSQLHLDNHFTLFTLPTRHFSGRGLKRNYTLWCSYLLQSPSMKIYLGGDSGYDTHFAEIGLCFENIDLAILENGQYNKAWRYIHMFPEEVLQAVKDLKAKRLLPVHSSKFALAHHPWNEPLSAITALNKQTNIPLITPLIGEKVYLKEENQCFKAWWEF